MKKTAVLAIASGLGSGYSPIAPGTAGSAVGLVVVWALSGTGALPYILICLALFGVGTVVSGLAEEIYGAKDCGKITIDEVVGMMLTLWLLPVTPVYLAAGFLLFRIFDIVKPFPAGRIDRHVHGGLGVMLDDVFAALYANVCLQVFRMVVA